MTHLIVTSLTDPVISLQECPSDASIRVPKVKANECTCSKWKVVQECPASCGSAGTIRRRRRDCVGGPACTSEFREETCPENPVSGGRRWHDHTSGSLYTANFYFAAVRSCTRTCYRLHSLGSMGPVFIWVRGSEEQDEIVSGYISLWCFASVSRTELRRRTLSWCGWGNSECAHIRGDNSDI